MADFFKRVSSVISLDMFFFAISKVFSIYGLSPLFVGS